MTAWISKSRKVAGELAREIHSGKLAAGMRLGSIRKQAARFGVSQKVIMDAMDILDSECLIERFPRSGILVKTRMKKMPLEVVIILPRRPGPYLSRMLDILLPENREDGFEFICRTVDYAHHCGMDELSRELKRILYVFHPDCFIISAPKFNTEEVKICTETGVPFLFVGDFARPETFRADYLQVTGDNYIIGESAVLQLSKLSPSQKVACLCGKEDYYFYREVLHGFRETAKKIGVEVFVYQLPHGFADLYLPEQKVLIDDFTAKASAAGFGSCPIADLGLYAELFSRFGRGLAGRIYVQDETAESKKNFLRQIYRNLRYAAEKPSGTRSVVTSGNYQWKPYQ